jgi:hypothetical protein
MTMRIFLAFYRNVQMKPKIYIALGSGFNWVLGYSAIFPLRQFALALTILSASLERQILKILLTQHLISEMTI